MLVELIFVFCQLLSEVLFGLFDFFAKLLNVLCGLGILDDFTHWSDHIDELITCPHFLFLPLLLLCRHMREHWYARRLISDTTRGLPIQRGNPLLP